MSNRPNESEELYYSILKLEQATSVLRAMMLSTDNNLESEEDLTPSDVGNICKVVVDLLEPMKVLYYEEGI